MKYLLPFTNWRIVVITLLAAITLLLAMCDGECFILVFGTKVVAVILGYATHVLARRWYGKMPELEVFSIEEDEEGE
jgi:hypothetical protein